MQFERFERRRSRQRDIPLITVSKKKQFGLNRTCLEKYFQGCHFVELYYDSHNHRIGFKPIQASTDCSYNLRVTRRSQGTISGTAFFKHYKLKLFDVSKAFPATFDEKEGLIIIDLKEEGIIVGKS